MRGLLLVHVCPCDPKMSPPSIFRRAEIIIIKRVLFFLTLRIFWIYIDAILDHWSRGDIAVLYHFRIFNPFQFFSKSLSTVSSKWILSQPSATPAKRPSIILALLQISPIEVQSSTTIPRLISCKQISGSSIWRLVSSWISQVSLLISIRLIRRCHCDCLYFHRIQILAHRIFKTFQFFIILHIWIFLVVLYIRVLG